MQGRHQRSFFGLDRAVIGVGQQPHTAIQRFELQVVASPAARETAQLPAILERDIHYRISRRDARAGIGQRLLQFRQRGLASDVRKIGTGRAAAARDGVASAATAPAEEEAFPRRRIARWFGVERIGIQGADVIGQSGHFGRGKRESRHATGSSIPNGIGDIAGAAHPQPPVAQQGRPPVGPTRIRSMADAATLLKRLPGGVRLRGKRNRHYKCEQENSFQH